jgi:anti-anti-sigma factor
MFQIQRGDNGEIVLEGRLDASQAETAQEVLDTVTESQVLDLKGLDYVASAGLAVLLRTQKRLMSQGDGLRLINVSKHIFDIFRYSGFDQVFSIETSG